MGDYMACKFYLNKVVKKYEWTTKKHVKCKKSLQQEKDQNKQEKGKMNLKETAITENGREFFKRPITVRQAMVNPKNKNRDL